MTFPLGFFALRTPVFTRWSPRDCCNKLVPRAAVRPRGEVRAPQLLQPPAPPLRVDVGSKPRWIVFFKRAAQDQCEKQCGLQWRVMALAGEETESDGES